MICDMEEIRIIHLKDWFLNPPNIYLPCDKLLKNSSIGKISLKKSSDYHTIFVDYFLINIDLKAVLDPSRYVGRAPEQTLGYLEQCVKPFLSANAANAVDGGAVNV